ncbi:hypothetical protein BJY00DRAFT_226175 [Aspergillus carlsbadensis]|nr:hypothetical protein BJY00DRAFT_226175 [Aspergillus carlsbadensis]
MSSPETRIGVPEKRIPSLWAVSQVRCLPRAPSDLSPLLQDFRRRRLELKHEIPNWNQQQKQNRDLRPARGTGRAGHQSHSESPGLPRKEATRKPPNPSSDSTVSLTRLSRPNRKMSEEGAQRLILTEKDTVEKSFR